MYLHIYLSESRFIILSLQIRKLKLGKIKSLAGVSAGARI